MNYDMIILVYIAFLAALLTPGANIMFLFEKSISDGSRGCVAAAIGLALGSLTWSTVSTVTVFASYAMSTTLSAVLGILGGLYLISLGFRRARAGLHVDLSASENPSSGFVKTVVSGYLIMVTNPKALFAWIGIVSALSVSRAIPADYVAVVIGTFILAFSAHALIGLLFSSAAMLSAYKNAVFFLNLVFVLVYSVLGVFLLIYSVRSLTLH